MSLRRRDDGIIHADDYNLPFDGSADVSSELEWLWRRMDKGDVFEFHRNGFYRSDETIYMLGQEGRTFLGNNATLFSTHPFEFACIYMLAECVDIKYYNLNINGYSERDATGASYVGIVGSPTINGTGIELNAQDETVSRPAPSGAVARYTAYGRDKEGYVEWDITVSDTAGVVGDFMVWLTDEFDTTDILASETWTLTPTPTIRRFRWRPLDIRQRPRFFMKKVTPTANTITIANVRRYRMVDYDIPVEGNAGWRFDNSWGLLLDGCNVEAIGGDGVQSSASTPGAGPAVNIKIRNMLSKGCLRQGMSFNYNIGVDCQDVVIIHPGRSGIDIEPYTGITYSKDFWFKNFEIFGTGGGGLSSINWGRIFNVNVDNMLLVDIYAARAHGGGATGGNYNNIRHLKTYDINNSGPNGSFLADFTFTGQNLHVTNIVADRGIQVTGTANMGPYGQLSHPAGISIDGFEVTRPAPGQAIIVEQDVSNVSIKNGPGDNANQFPIFGRSGVHRPVGSVASLRHGSAIHNGLLQHRLPKTYPGIAHTSVHMPGGFDLLDEPLHRVAGLGGSNTAVTLQAMTTRTTTGVTTGVDVGEATALRLRLYNSATSGTLPTLYVELQQSHDNVTFATVDYFRTLRDSSTTVTTTTEQMTEWTETLEIRNTARYLRLAYTIGGTSPSFTFEVIGDKTVAANNLRDIAATVTASATTHAVLFPAKTHPNPTSVVLTGIVGTGTLTPSGTYYYRVAGRALRGGPVVPLAQSSITLSATANAVDINPLGIENLALGVQIPAITVYRGTVNGGPYTQRADCLPNGRFFNWGRNSQLFQDFGATLGITVGQVLNMPSCGGYPPSVPWRAGSFTPVDETGWELDANYEVLVETNWNSGHPYVTSKARTGFTINFPNAAPGDGSGRVSWTLIR